MKWKTREHCKNRMAKSWLVFRLVSLTPLLTAVLGIACAGVGFARQYELFGFQGDPASNDWLVRFGTSLSIPGIFCVLLVVYYTFRTRLLKRRKAKRQVTPPT